MKRALFVAVLFCVVSTFASDLSSSNEPARTADCVFRFGGYRAMVSLGMDSDSGQRFMNGPLCFRRFINEEARRKYKPEIDRIWRDWHLSLYELECAFCNGDENAAKKAIDALVEKKGHISKKYSRARREYYFYLLSLEDSLARIVLDGSDKVRKCMGGTGSRFFTDLLSNEDFDLDSETKEYAQSAYSFRNMIGLAMEIDICRREQGTLPVSISDIASCRRFLLDGYGRPIAYTVKDGRWLLYSAGVKNKADTMPFDVYVPHVLFSPNKGYSRISSLWFSESYSQKRWQWYQSRCLYKGTPNECWMPEWWR